jgi:hypothetical protein
MKQSYRNPKFALGESVVVVSPGIHRNKAGRIHEIIQSTSGDFVFKYRVRFPDETVAVFFGFELSAIASESASA